MIYLAMERDPREIDPYQLLGLPPPIVIAPDSPDKSSHLAQSTLVMPGDPTATEQEELEAREDIHQQIDRSV